jgi:tetratricopeptide (TPR) repeat protein
MPTIFISFSTRDGEDIADHLYGHYKENGYNVFYSSKEIPYGSSWREEIKKHIKECDILLVIATYDAIDSQEVAKEIDEAKRLGKRIVPCRPKDIEWSNLEKLGIDLSHGLEFDNKYDLVRKLEAQLRREFEVTSVRPPLRNDTRQYETGLTSSKYEPSLQTEYKDKEEVDALFSKAEDLYNTGRYGEAINYCDKALKLNPNYLKAWHGKGVALAKLRKYEEAITCYDKAIELDPNNAYIWLGKGSALCDLDKYEEGITCYDKAIELNPDYLDAYRGKGLAIGKLGVKRWKQKK